MKKVLSLALTAAVLFGCTADGVFNPNDPNLNPDNPNSDPTKANITWADGGKVLCKMSETTCVEMSKKECDKLIANNRAEPSKCAPGTEPVYCLTVIDNKDEKKIECPTTPMSRTACAAKEFSREVKSCDGIKTHEGSGGDDFYTFCQENFVSACCGLYPTLPQCGSVPGQNAIPLTAGIWMVGTVSASADEVLYSFPVSEGTVYRVYLEDSDNSSYTSDVGYAAFYSDNTEIFDGDNYTNYMDFTARSSGTVYVVVYMYYASGVGTFRVKYDY